ncbi:matrixin family metalloprotease [Lentilactobacillus diolivorans]|uniref:matrixin family metalloprotease n=1 Tax=Lentilactobacillus diolivorans TaxID=179838 RepID=UPI0024689EE4|nr:matrixin family metalloprotease [Lentilactobacillus diolivorans]MDH5105022.1 matrixin family metalloprotease [Lentilactobacillus diolivorans]
MKWINRLIALIIVLLTLNIFIQPGSLKSIGHRVNNAIDLPTMLKVEIDKDNHHENQTQQKATQTDANATPIESIVQGRTLSNRYYYHFANGVGDRAKQAFLSAVSDYNKTGIVRLEPQTGKVDSQANQLTFYVYKKRVENGSGAVELGLGGPQIYPWIGNQNDDLNRGRAGLNAEYPQSSMQKPVALHEIGHALGLDHSTKRDSIMYPVDQGETKLSSGDLAGLKEIYHK